MASSDTLFIREYDSIGDALRGEQRHNGGHPLPWDFLTGKYYSEPHYGVIVAVVEE